MSLGDEAEVEAERVAMAKLRAMAHPVRLRILSLLTGAAMTAADVARELGITHANASYHLRQLLAVGEIEPAGEESIRGGLAKRYRYPLTFEEPAVRMADGPARPEQRLVYTALADELTRRAAQIRRRRGNYLADAEVWVEPEVWAEIRERVKRASVDLHRAAKPPRTEGTIRVNATLALFEMYPEDQESP